MRAFLALALALAIFPAASAHTSVVSSDDRYRAVIGLLEEPVVTYQKTGLDLCFQQNTTARAPIATVNPGGLTATLIAPDGATHTQDLRAQFGRAGCFQFQDPFVLTVPGQYTVTLVGDLNGTPVDFRGVAAGGPVKDASVVQFPNDDPTPGELALNKASQDEVDLLAARVEALESQRDGKSNDAPWPTALALPALAAVVVAIRRRQ